MRVNSKKIIFLLIICVLYANSSYSWNISYVVKKNFFKIGTYSQLKATKYKHFPIIIHMVLLDFGKYSASLEVQDKNAISSVMEVSLKHNALLAVNGGYYREKFLPNGLLVYKGVIRSNLVFNNLLEGIVSISELGELNLYKRKNKHIKAKYAFQTGPILNINGKPYNSNSTMLRQRSAIVQFKNKDIAILSFSPVSLNDMSRLINRIATLINLQVKLALNLDGGLASSFVVNFQYYPVILPEYKPVKSIIMFKER